ncbi:MAG: prepilin peptidase [Lachnospiraceae bacterium]|nr:prepilin peptidase [Lachnospiraceae bacterium]
MDMIFLILKYMIMLALLIISSITDIKENKIKNKIIITGLFSGIFLNVLNAFFMHGPKTVLSEFIDSVLRVFIVLLIGFMLYKIHAFGAGDAKLYSIIALFYNLIFTLRVFLLSCLVVCIYGLIKIFLIKANIISDKKRLIKQKSKIDNSDKPKHKGTKVIFAPTTLICFIIISVIRL